MSAELSPPELRFTLLTTEHALKEWSVLSGILEPALDHGMVSSRTSIDHIREGIEQDYLQTFVIWDSAASQVLACLVARVDVHPTGVKVLSFPAMGGQDLATWINIAWDGIRQFAKGQECHQIEFRGRPGWSKILSAEPVSVNYIEVL
jgi:hypothetical protein